ncbi:MAG: HEAT repeat domain-containing protein [Planctomycetaceae bacterium]|nr:HEAT repeat domain-containing protein [Planctomycetaceae bacterium]
MTRHRFLFVTLCTVSFLTAGYLFAQDTDWQQASKEYIADKSGEIAKKLQTPPHQGGAAEEQCLQILKRTEDDRTVLFLKMLACKQLGKYGTPASVPVLLPLFDKDKQGFYARYALETLPGAKVDAEILQYLKKLNVPAAIAGTLTTLGVRAQYANGNADSAAAVKDFLKHDDLDVRKAAAYAFASCGGDSAIEFFTDKKLDPEQADSGFLLAEMFLNKKGEKEKALKIYDALAEADIRPYQKNAAVLQGLLVRGGDAAPQLARQLLSPSPKEFAVALKAGREMQGGAAVADVLIAQISREKDSFRKSGIVRSLGGRKDKESVAAALPVITKLALDGEDPVRIAAIESLGKIGDASILPILIAAANQTEAADVTAAANKVLANLSGPGVDDAIVKLAENGEGTAKAAAVKLIEERRIVSAFPLLMKSAGDSNENVRNAALSALGQTAAADDIPALLKLMNAADSKLMDEIIATLKSVVTRVPADIAVEQVAAQLEKAATPVKAVLLELLQEIGGVKALTLVEGYARGNAAGNNAAGNNAASQESALLQDAATEVLGKWSKANDMDVVANVCLKLAGSLTGKYRDRSLSGAVRVARQFAVSEEQRIRICSEAFKLAGSDKERLLVVDVYWRHPSLKMLAEVMKYIGDPALTEQTCESAVKLSEKIQEKSPDVKKAMESVLEKTKDNAVRDKARIVLGRQ